MGTILAKKSMIRLLSIAKVEGRAQVFKILESASKEYFKCDTRQDAAKNLGISLQNLKNWTIGKKPSKAQIRNILRNRSLFRVETLFEFAQIEAAPTRNTKNQGTGNPKRPRKSTKLLQEGK